MGNLGGAGTQTAGLAFGGGPGGGNSTTTKEYDGSTWTAGGSLNVSNSFLAALGTQTAAIGAGGYNPSPASVRITAEQYNGTSWTATVSYTHLPSPRDRQKSRMPSSA